MLLSSDTSVGITKSMGVALIGFADFFGNHKPDMVIILGELNDPVPIFIGCRKMQQTHFCYGMPDRLLREREQNMDFCALL